MGNVWTTCLRTASPALRGHRTSAGSSPRCQPVQGEQNVQLLPNHVQKAVTNNFIRGFRPDSRSLHWEWVRASLWA